MTMNVGLEAIIEPKVDKRKADHEASKLKEKFGAAEQLEPTVDTREVESQLNGVSFEPEVEGVGQPRGGAAGGVGGVTNAGAMGVGAGTAGALGGAVSGGMMSVALSGATSFGILAGINKIASASPAWQQTAKLFDDAMSLFFRPFGNALANTFRPLATSMIKLSTEFNKLVESDGLAVAVASLPEMAWEASKGNRDVLAGMGIGGAAGAIGGAKAGAMVGGAAGSVIPGPGTAVGATVGAGAGLAAGAIGGGVIGDKLGDIDLSGDSLRKSLSRAGDSVKESLEAGASTIMSLEATDIIQFSKDIFKGSIKLGQWLFEGAINWGQWMFKGAINWGQWMFSGAVGLGSWIFSGAVSLGKWMFTGAIDLTDYIGWGSSGNTATPGTDGMTGSKQSGSDLPNTGMYGSNTKMASGGVVTKPTQALVGEAGAEAILPLSDLKEIIQSAAEAGSQSSQGAGGGVDDDGIKERLDDVVRELRRSDGSVELVVDGQTLAETSRKSSERYSDSRMVSK